MDFLLAEKQQPIDCVSNAVMLSAAILNFNLVHAN